MIFNIQLSMVTASHSFSREDQHRALCMCYSKHLEKKRRGDPKRHGDTAWKFRYLVPAGSAQNGAGHPLCSLQERVRA